jgi:4-hydroxy-tetrahydrodipicolinate synthase
VLVLPPFYYKNQADEGFFAYFAAIIERIGDPRLRLYLYHFPQMSAAPISASLIERLIKAYPETVAGLKDSSGDWEGTKRLIAEFPELAIFPSSEVRLMEGLGLGAAGCISATANIQPGPIARLIASHGSAEAQDWHRRISTVRGIVEAYPFITACKAIVASKTGDEAWLQTRPPITPLQAGRRDELLAALAASGAALKIDF